MMIWNGRKRLSGREKRRMRREEQKRMDALIPKLTEHEQFWMMTGGSDYLV